MGPVSIGKDGNNGDVSMDVFRSRDDLIAQYQEFSHSFTQVRAPDILDVVEEEYRKGRYWPAPLVQLNPNYHQAETVQELCDQGVLHPLAAEIFRARSVRPGGMRDVSLRLYQHQVQAISIAQGRQSYVVTTGTGSGKSLTFFIPIIDHILRARESDTRERIRSRSWRSQS